MKPRVPITRSSSFIDSVETCPHCHLASQLRTSAPRVCHSKDPYARQHNPSRQKHEREHRPTSTGQLGNRTPCHCESHQNHEEGPVGNRKRTLL